MKFSRLSAVPLVLGSLSSAFTYERLNKNDTLLLIVDMQEGLYSLARDYDATVLKNALYAHAALGKVFDLPVVMTSSSETGPNGPLPDEFLQWYPNAPLIKRQGEVDAWDNPEFKEAVIAANKSQIIIAGITTDVCTTFLALSLREAGYTVFANHEASGTTTVDIREHANERMRAAGVQILSYFAIVCELMRDWRNVPGSEQVLPLLDQYYPAYGMVARAHRAAVDNGTVLQGEDILP
ncbi:Isochorismatase hydrolase [Annulohypoxylon moriforme]|nr:Isochorismatase hydrolase [Annulohypoxylon moriforme]